MYSDCGNDIEDSRHPVSVRQPWCRLPAPLSWCLILLLLSSAGQAAVPGRHFYSLPLWELPSLQEMATLIEKDRGRVGAELIAQNNTKNNVFLGIGQYMHRLAPGSKESIALAGINQLLSVSLEVNPKHCGLKPADLDYENCLEMIHYGYYKVPMPIAFNVNLFNEFQISTGHPAQVFPWKNFKTRHLTRNIRATFKPKLAGNFYWNIDKAYEASQDNADLLYARLSSNPFSDWEIGSYIIDDPVYAVRIQAAPFMPNKTAYGDNNYIYFSWRWSSQQKAPIILRNHTDEDVSLMVESIISAQTDFVRVDKRTNLELMLPPDEKSIVRVLRSADNNSCNYGFGACWEVLYEETHKHPTFFSLEKNTDGEQVFHYSEGSL